MKQILILLGIITQTYLSAQKITFYKDQNLRKETSKKKAKFKKIEYKSEDTLLVQTLRISDSLILNEEKWIQEKPVGIWSKYDLNGDVILVRDLNKMTYSKDPIKGFYDNGNTDTANYKPASYSVSENGILEFIVAEFIYPPISIYMGHYGKIQIRVIIDRNGNVKPHSILEGVDSFCDLEVWELFERMPKWNPATKNDSPVDSFSIIPIILKFN